MKPSGAQLVAVAARTSEGVETLLEKAEESSNDSRFLTLMQRALDSSVAMQLYRGFTVLNSTKKFSDVQVH